MADHRTLITHLCDELDHNRRMLLDDRQVTHPLADRARAALAEPEPEWPTDEEIMELMPQQMRDDLAAAARAMSGFDPDNIKAASVFRIILNRHSVDHARAVLARWGRPAPVPAGERQAALVPVAVSERLPGPEDCRFNPGATVGACWCWNPPACVAGIGHWSFEPLEWAEDATHWLPAQALPLPSVEVER